MNRKSIAWMFLVLLVVFSLGLAGCQRSAVKKTPIPEEGTQTVEEAAKNSQTPQAGKTPVAQVVPTNTPKAEEPKTTEATTAAPQATTAPAAATPVPPTATPTAAPVVAPTATPKVTPTSVQATPGKHVVQAGENLFRIALRYGMTTEALARANNITNPARIYVGQVLTIPGANTGGTPAPTPTPAPVGTDIQHVVKAGENLFRIALKYGYDQYYIAKYNGISNPALIYVGQVIRIPKK